MTVESIGNTQDFQRIISASNVSVIHFYAEWADQCAQVTEVLKLLAGTADVQKAGMKVYLCEAESLSEVSLEYKIDSVPTVLWFEKGSLVDRVDGADVAKISSKVKSRTGKAATADSPAVPLQERLKQLINRHNVMVFMKGDRSTPRCGFSKTLIGILNETGVQYNTFDILTDEEVRQGLKEYSDWPTYPQVYVKGDLIGGLDIIKEIQASGDLGTTLNP